MKIVVTGAFSYTGKYITRHLLDKGAEVITLTNHPNRPDPFEGKVKAFPLDFGQESRLTSSLSGVDVLVNTYWVRFDRGKVTQSGAVENTRTLMRAAMAAGVRRIVHISITAPSLDSNLPYFYGKAVNEQSVTDSGMSFSILRPTLIFGREDILINNIAWILRRFPFFVQIGDGRYKLQPVFVDDLAEIACQSVYENGNSVLDVTGPETFSFDDLVSVIGQKIGCPRPILHFPAGMALQAARLLSLFIGDVLITKEEVQGLMAGLLVSSDPPRGTTSLSGWLAANRATVGVKYASEIARHYR
jgi:NADH dehydrogenase